MRRELPIHFIKIGSIRMRRLNAMLLFPCRQHHLSFRSQKRTDMPSIDGRQLRRTDPRCFQICIQDVLLLPHRHIRVKHLLCALIRVGNIPHDVDLTIFEFLETVHPVAVHILESPARIAGDLLHELIAIATAHAILIDEIEGIFERTDTHHLSLCAADGHRQQETKPP